MMYSRLGVIVARSSAAAARRHGSAAASCRRGMFVGRQMSTAAATLAAASDSSNPNKFSTTATRIFNLRSLHTSARMLGEVVEVAGPAFAESISEGDIRWLKKQGDSVGADELVAEIETDKTAVEVPAPFAGKIVELLVKDGSKVVAKQKLYKLEKTDGSSSGGGGSSSAAAAESSPPPAQKKEEPSESSPPPSSQQQQQQQQKPETESSEPPKRPGQQITFGKHDIPSEMPPVSPPPKAPISSKPVSDIQIKPAAPSKAGDSCKAVTGERTETRVKMNRMRLRIAERLKQAQNVNAMLTTFNEVDLSNVIEMRKKFQEDFTKKHGIKLGLMSPFVRAAAIALQDQPVVNAVIEEAEIVYRHFCDISVAVATPKGLVVPVLRNVESMGFADIEKGLAELGAKARDGKLAIEDMEGGTFTISNGGVFGSLMGTPIINPPQSAILGMHGIFDRPVAVSGKVEIRPMMYVALTYDHRLIDGREAVVFLRKIKSAVEDPLSSLLDL